MSIGQAFAAVGAPRARTPEAFGRALKRWLATEETYRVLDEYTGGTWLAGGCWLLAKALSRWTGGEEVALIGRALGGVLGHPPQIHHVVVKHGDLYFDGDGASTASTLLRRWRTVEMLADPRLVPLGRAERAWARRSGIPCPAGGVRRLRVLLEERFGPPSAWGF